MGKSQTFLQTSALINNLTQSIFKINSLAPHKSNCQKGFIKLSRNTLISYLIISTALFGSGVIFLFNPFGTTETQAAWFNDNWAYRKEVPITANAAADTDAFFSFTLDTSALITAGQLQSSCQDIRVTDVNGNILQYHVGRTNACNNAATTIDALPPYASNSSTPTLPAGASTFYVYYGNPSVISADHGAFSQSEAASYTVGTLGSAVSGPAPTLYWKFDDAQGTNAQDSTTNGLDGTLNNTPTWQTENQCIAGKCIYFSLNGNKSVSKSDDPKLDFAAADNFTISLWMKHPGAIAGTQQILTKAAGSPYAGYKVYMDASGDLCFETRDGTNGADSACTSAVDFDDDNWHFVTGVKNGTSSITLYVDGKQRAQDTSIASTGSLANSGTLYAGIDQDGTSNDWYGFIDEIKITRDQTARTTAQVLADFNARSNPEGVSGQQGNNNQNIPSTLSNGLVGYWKMDEASWSNNCSTTSVLDSSGNGYNGVSCPNGTGPTGGATGKFGNGGSFDGTNDIVQGEDFDSNPLLSGTKRWSVAGWFKTSDTDGYIFDTRDADSSTFDGAALYTDGSNTLKIYVNSDSATTVKDWTYSITSTDGNWHNFVFTRDGDNSFTLYLDGVKLTPSAQTTNDDSTNQSDTWTEFHFGNRHVSNVYPLNGTLDEMRIYNRAFTPTEVAQLYNWAPGPSIYLRMDENTGSTTYDASGNGKNGTLASSTATPTWTAAKYGAGLGFDGSNDRVNVTSPNLPTTDFTYGAWVYKRATGGGIILNAEDDSGGDADEIHLSINGSELLQLRMNNSTVATSSNTVPLNTWTHVAATRVGSAVRVYINGVQDGSGTNSSTLNFGDCDLVIGIDAIDACPNSSYGSGLNSKIDDVKVYNYGRTQAQIIEDMNAGHPAPGSPVGTPLGNWRFDEGYGTTANNVGNAGNSGSTYTGTLTNMSSPATSTSGWTNSGKFGKALLFDGTNDRVDYGDMTVLEGLNQATWSIWVNPTSLATSQGIAVKANNAATGQSWAIMTDSSTSSAVRVRIATGDSDQSTYGVTPSGALTNGKWTHIMVVFDGTGSGNSDRLKVYINGQPQTLSFTGTIPSTLNATTSIMRVSGWSDAGGSYFNGAMDEYKIYTESLTAEQVKLDMNRSQSEVLGATGTSSTAGNDNASTRTAQSSASQYCIPGDSSTCTGPAGEWNLDEGSGTNAQDSSTNGNTGTITAGSGSYLNGKINKAYSFDGSSTLINAGSGTSLDNLPASGMTAEAWIYPTGAGEGNAGFIMAKNNGSSQNAGWLFLTLNTGGPTRALQFVIDGSTDLVKTTSNNVYSYNTWNHVAVTSNSDFSAGSVHIYVNGNEVSYSGSSGGSSRVSDAASSLYIGNASSGDRTFAGIIDQVRVYNYERTPAQIAWDYNQGKPVAHWKMDECQGTTISDMSGNSLTGTINLNTTGTQTTAIGHGTCSVNASTPWYNGAIGKRNYSLNLDGTNDYVSMASAPSVSSENGTMSAWVKTTKNFSDTGMIMYGCELSSCSDGFGAQHETHIHFNADETIGAFFYASTGTSTLTSTNTYSDGNWHLVTATWIRGGALRLYVDGIVVASGTSTSAISYNFGPVFNIGANSIPSRYYGGQIDDSRIYNYALTDVQVKTLYNDGAAKYGPVTGAP